MHISKIVLSRKLNATCWLNPSRSKTVIRAHQCRRRISFTSGIHFESVTSLLVYSLLLSDLDTRACLVCYAKPLADNDIHSISDFWCSHGCCMYVNRISTRCIQYLCHDLMKYHKNCRSASAVSWAATDRLSLKANVYRMSWHTSHGVLLTFDLVKVAMIQTYICIYNHAQSFIALVGTQRLSTTSETLADVQHSGHSHSRMQTVFKPYH